MCICSIFLFHKYFLFYYKIFIYLEDALPTLICECLSGQFSSTSNATWNEVEFVTCSPIPKIIGHFPLFLVTYGRVEVAKGN